MTPIAALTPRTADIPPAADGKARRVAWYDLCGEPENWSVPYAATFTAGGKVTGYGVEELPSVGHLTFRVRKAGSGTGYTVTCGPAGGSCDCAAGDIGHVELCRHRLMVEAAVMNGWV